ncbi:hypothetical protein ANO11243_075440 [Dothideomycetidae sp. 11243]|nr:hypothetical protein ANO11243_075440 [fungal sp. No.11243]
MLTPTIGQFLDEIATILRQRDAPKLSKYLVIEPPYAPIYETLRSEVRSSYSAPDGTSIQRLETLCQEKLGQVLIDPDNNAPTWSAFVKFMAQYFVFLRDVDVANLLATYELLSELLHGSGNNGLDAQGRPEGKKRGIYTIANQCLKILFQCRKIRGAAQIFENIYNQSPPLAAFPKSERVTYLYYLGRFSWANGHFFRAQSALQHAWNNCHVRCSKQARLIAIYLIAANLVCGRFPKPALLDHVSDLRQHFEPLCLAIRKGDLVTFRRLLEPGSDSYPFFSRYRIDLQLRNRCEPYVWRSLVRRTFLLRGDRGQPEARKAPTMDLNDLLALWKAQETGYARVTTMEAETPTYIDDDFEVDDNMGSNGFSMTDVVSRLSSLIHQDLVNGYLSFKLQKLALQGARQKGAVAGGFPSIWGTISARCAKDEVPGWKLEMRSGRNPLGSMGGQVINLSGARAVGAS